ncbi:MAG: cell division protein FtsZ [Rikenellaceae bacterium]|nr:cell division protein FtsZ [Rikenellaceae bacterium]
MPEIIDVFELPKAAPSIIMVAGVGGGGSNAVNHMFHLGITDVSFMVCNTDMQALNRSQIPIKIVLGQSLTQGLGAGNKPEIGRAAAEESYDEIVDVFKRHGTRMVFVTAGMGGGTGTGAAPVIARAAKELGILTVAIVTIPFVDEGPKRFKQAYQGIDEIKKYVDSLLVINNENILEIHGDLTLSEAFGMADNILADAAKGIAEIITGDNYVNVDFKDVQTVMSDSGVALMGTGKASGDNRANDAVQKALSSPLLNHRDIAGARNILVNITSSDEHEAKLSEMKLITKFVQEKTGNAADLIWGFGKNMGLGEDIQVTIIATGFDSDAIEGFPSYEQSVAAEKVEENGQTELQEGIDNNLRDQGLESENTDTAETESVPENKPQEEIQTSVQQEPVKKVERIEPDINIIRAKIPVPSPAMTNEPRTKKIEEPVTESINYEELENTPAWLRRKVSFNDNSSDKISRVHLKEDTNTVVPDTDLNKGLF